MDIAEVIDWTSVKLTGGSVFLGLITGNQILMGLAGLATISTIVYNAIRIYKELKRKTDA